MARLKFHSKKSWHKLKRVLKKLYRKSEVTTRGVQIRESK